MNNKWVSRRLEDATGREKTREIQKLMLTNPESVQKKLVRIKEDGKIAERNLDNRGYIIKK